MRVAIKLTGGASWTGGVTYCRNLLRALADHAPEVELYLVTGPQGEPAVEAPGVRVLRSALPHGGLPRLVARITKRALGHDFAVRQALRALPGGFADVVFPEQFLVGRRTAVISWIPDFQFVHLPEMFSSEQIAHLSAKFTQVSRRATLVVLSSHDARKDFCSFAPRFASKARVMSFVAHTPKGLYDVDSAAVVDRYNLPRKFIYLPNQFWKHKNHIVVIEALRILKGKGIAPFLVLTGNPCDVRNPLHFAELLQKASVWGVRDQMALLGLVPHDDVYSLIRQSICVLNPSFFEGWSTSVEEAKTVGKSVLLSDLPVHREQDPPAACFFDPCNADELADKMARFWASVSPGPDDALETLARGNAAARMRAFAHTFVRIAQEAVETQRGRAPAFGAAGHE